MNKVEQYELIDWNAPNNEYKTNKVVYMTTDEAHERNRMLTEANTTQRYVKANGSTSNTNLRISNK